MQICTRNTNISKYHLKAFPLNFPRKDKQFFKPVIKKLADACATSIRFGNGEFQVQLFSNTNKANS